MQVELFLSPYCLKALPSLDNRTALSENPTMVGIADRILERILSIILSHRPAGKIVVFGSRACGNANPTSDIDVAVIDSRWTQRDIDLFHNSLEEDVPTALKIDLLAPHLLQNEELRERILREGIVIHE